MPSRLNIIRSETGCTAAIPRSPDPEVQWLPEECDRPVPDALGVAVQFSRNQTIFTEGDAVRFIYKIVSGAVRLCKITQDGRRQIVQFLLPGDILGIGPQNQHVLTAESIDKVSAKSFPVSSLEQPCGPCPRGRDCMLEMLGRDVCASRTHLIILGLPTAHERVASFILNLADRSRINSGRLRLPMHRLDIADYIGLTIETVSRIFSELRRAGIVDIPERHSITIRNRAVLQRIAAGHIEPSMASI